MRKRIFLAATVSVALIGGSMVNFALAAPPNGKGGKQTGGEGGTEIEAAVGPAEMPADADPNFTAQGCYDIWYISGKHSWKWGSTSTTSWNELSATSYATTGTTSGSCGYPYRVDWLRTQGTNVGAVDSNHNATVNKTEYNVSTSTAYKKVTVTGPSASGVCGARATHTASKNGTQASYWTYSGCAY